MPRQLSKETHFEKVPSGRWKHLRPSRLLLSVCSCLAPRGGEDGSCGLKSPRRKSELEHGQILTVVRNLVLSSLQLLCL